MLDAFRQAAEQALSALWAAPIALAEVKALREAGRNRAWRLAVTGGPAKTVILKAFVGSDEHPYVDGDTTPDSSFRRLCNEAAGAAMLAPMGLGPTVLATDRALGFTLLEDLGEGETLAGRLLADDPAAATDALFAYARSLGDLHAATAGQAPRWTALLAELGSPSDAAGSVARGWRSAPSAFADLCRELGTEAPPGVEAELSAIGRALSAPGPYLAFTPSDCCPDNHFLRGDRVVFFDCEWATVRHALLDAAYFLAPFPSCWCCAAMPEGLPGRLLAAYRERFDGGADFDEQLTMALAFWLMVILQGGPLAPLMEADRPWGITTVRQRVRALIANLLARPNLSGLFPALSRALADMDANFAARWADTLRMPLYPAFR